MTTDYLLLIFFTSCLSATDPLRVRMTIYILWKKLLAKARAGLWAPRPMIKKLKANRPALFARSATRFILTNAGIRPKNWTRLTLRQRILFMNFARKIKKWQKAMALWVTRARRFLKMSPTDWFLNLSKKYETSANAPSCAIRKTGL